MTRRLVPAVLAALCVFVVPAAAQVPVRAGDDPGRWVSTGGQTDIPLNWYQGVTTDEQGNWFFSGIYTGIYRSAVSADGTLATGAEGARNDHVIPPALTATEGYDHIGDFDHDRAEGGRLLLPLECFAASPFAGRAPGSQTFCKRGGIGVLDPVTLQWRYHVYAQDMARLMWDEVSPDGHRVWTSPSGDDATPNDLIAYCAADIRAARAGETIPVETRIKDAVPPSRITGAAFWGDRLYVAGHDEIEGDETSTFRVWSIDVNPGPRQGERRLELSLELIGESEGLAVADVPRGDMDGLLHWQIQPYNTSNIPTYRQKSKLLHFRPAAGIKEERAAPERPCGSDRRGRARVIRARSVKRAHRTGRSTRR